MDDPRSLGTCEEANQTSRRWSFRSVPLEISSARTRSSSSIISTARSHPPPKAIKSSRSSSFSRGFQFPNSDTLDESKLKSTSEWLKTHFKRGTRSNSIAEKNKRQMSMNRVNEEEEYVKHINLSSTNRVPIIINGKSDILSNNALALMEETLPQHYRGYNWILLFSSLRDGSNYIQFYEKVKFEEPTFIVVETMSGEVFGGFAASPWKDCSTGQYYGCGECFLFKQRNSLRKNEDEEICRRLEGEKVNFDSISKYLWTGMNTFFQYSISSGIGLGGGGDNFGLYIGDDFAVGCSGRCTTFDNEPLCTTIDFTICQVEVYGFTQAKNEIQARIAREKKRIKQKRNCKR